MQGGTSAEPRASKGRHQLSRPGARCAVSGAAREKVRELADRVTYLELNVSAAYMDEYTAALFLPHTDTDQFPSVKRWRGADAAKRRSGTDAGE